MSVDVFVARCGRFTRVLQLPTYLGTDKGGVVTFQSSIRPDRRQIRLGYLDSHRFRVRTEAGQPLRHECLQAV